MTEKCCECGDEIEWVEGMGAGFWYSPTRDYLGSRRTPCSHYTASERTCRFWVVALAVVAFMVVGFYSISAFARSVYAEARDDRKCTHLWCEDVVPWIVVVQGFGQTYGYEMRTENGCHLASFVAMREGADSVACYEDEESAEKDFPALQIVGEGQLGGD